MFKKMLFTVKTEKTFGESSVSRILALIEDGSDNKSHAEKFITRFAKWFTPVVDHFFCRVKMIIFVGYKKEL